MVINFVPNEFWYALVTAGISLIPILAWPECPIYCARCGKKEVGSFLWLSERTYCDDCRPHLTDEEKEDEQKFAEIIQMLIKLNNGDRLVLPRHIRKELEEIEEKKGKSMAWPES